MLNFALKYLRQGLSVIPLKPNRKEPLLKWQEFQNRRASEEEVKKWWSAAPNANIGIVTGKISNLVVIDLDGPEGLASATKLGLTSTVMSTTGRKDGGRHLWVSHPKDSLVANTVKSFPGLDIRADGGYVVAPPSIHPSGRRYRFLTSFVLSAMSNFPNALITVPNVKNDISDFKPKLDVAELLEEMKNGNRDQTLFKLCSRLRNDGYTKREALCFLGPHAERVGASSILQAKIENVWNRYEPRKSTGIYMDGRFGQSSTNLDNRLTIHSPTNPDSRKQFEQLRSERNKENTTGLQTGYPKLDEMLKGGLKSSRLFTVAARTGVGKTNWLIGVARSLCTEGKKILLFSTEMPYIQIWERYVAALGSFEEFRNHQFYICDSFAPNIERVEEAINEIKPDVFMFDHINHVSEEQKELGSFMQGLNFLSRKYAVAGIVTAQLNRSADWVDLKTGEKVTPRMSMIKGSGTIEQASSRVLLLSEQRVTSEMTEIIGNLDKNDNGPKGLLHFGLVTNPYRMIEL